MYSAMNMDLTLEHVRPVTTEHAEHVTQHAPQSQQELPSFNPSNMFLAGYDDCAQEALWYLTEVEKLPSNHPTVVALKRHLYEQYRVFQIQQMLQSALRMYNEEGVTQALPDENLDIECKDKGETSEMKITSTENFNESEIETESATESENTVQERLIADGTISAQKKNTDISSNFKGNSFIAPVAAGQETESESELSPEANMIAVALAEEIYALLQGQDDVSDDQDDYSEDLEDLSNTDDESVCRDEGFEEMVEP